MIQLSLKLMRTGLVISVLLLLLGWGLKTEYLVVYGLWVLVVLPIIRIMSLFFFFLQEKERTMSFMSLYILVILLVSFFIGGSV